MNPSLATLLTEHPAPHEQPLIYDDVGQLTGGQAREQVERLADELRAAGVQHGDAVISQLPNCAAAAVAMIAIWCAGAVFVPVNHRAPAAELERVEQALGPAAIINDQGVRSFGAASRHYDAQTAFVAWTSGTTGPPKAILHTHEGYLELLDRVLNGLRRGRQGSRPKAPNLVPVPLALNSGIYNLLFAFRAGRAVVIMDRFSSGRFAELIGRFEITSTVLPPAAIAMLTKDPTITDLAPLRFVRSVTAPLSPAVARSFHDRFGVFVLNSYGQAEVGEVIGWTASDAREFPDKVGAAGRPNPGVEVKIVSEQGVPLGRSETGQLMVRPQQMAVGYATGEDLGERFDAEGYLATGDLAYRDDDGFIWIAGRLGDVIVRGGNKVYPPEVEEVLRMLPAVADAAVIAMPDDRLGEIPVACIVDAPGVAPASDDELAALCHERLTPYKVPAAFHRIQDLPRNEIGKIRRSELHRMLTQELP